MSPRSKQPTINSKTIDRNCELCQSTEFAVLSSYNEPDNYEQLLDIATENYYRKWVKCENCDFIYSIYSRDVTAMDKLYSEIYRGNNVQWRTLSNKELFQKLIQLPETESETKRRVKWIKNNLEELTNSQIIQFDTTNKKLLDIGGGTGIFAYEFLEKDKWDSHIVDADPTGEYLEDEYNIKYVTNFYKPHLFEYKFDLISMVFSLEHISNPKTVLNTIKADMKDDSVLFIEIPDKIAFTHKNPNDDIFNSCHLWFFSPKSLIELLDQCGYECLTLARAKTFRGHYSIILLAKQKVADATNQRLHMQRS